MDFAFLLRFVFLFYPETKNLALERVGEVFRDKVVKNEEDLSQDEEGQVLYPMYNEAIED